MPAMRMGKFMKKGRGRAGAIAAMQGGAARGPGGGPRFGGARGMMPTRMGGDRIDMGPGDRGPGFGGRGRVARGIQAKMGGMMPAVGGGRETDIGVQSPAVMPPDAAAKPIPTGGSGQSADVGTGGTGPIDMGPTPKGVQDAGAGGGGRLVRPGTGLIQPPAAPAAAPVTPLAGEVQRGPGGVATGQPAAMLAGAPGLLRARQPLSGFKPQARKKPGSRFFTGA